MKIKGIVKLLLGIIILISFLYIAQLFLPKVLGKSGLNSLSDVLQLNVSQDRPVTLTDLQADYNAITGKLPEKVHVLIVPGHEPDSGGAQFGKIYERDLVVEIGKDLQQ